MRPINHQAPVSKSQEKVSEYGSQTQQKRYPEGEILTKLQVDLTLVRLTLVDWLDESETGDWRPEQKKAPSSNLLFRSLTDAAAQITVSWT